MFSLVYYYSMPVTRGAKKKLRQDIKRTRSNFIAKKATALAVKNYKKSPTEKNLTKAYSALDLAVKKNIFHKNKANRLKSRLSKLITVKKTQKTVKK
jgi:small subunit ribosomal protein S20